MSWQIKLVSFKSKFLFISFCGCVEWCFSNSIKLATNITKRLIHSTCKGNSRDSRSISLAFSSLLSLKVLCLCRRAPLGQKQIRKVKIRNERGSFALILVVYVLGLSLLVMNFQRVWQEWSFSCNFLRSVIRCSFPFIWRVLVTGKLKVRINEINMVIFKVGHFIRKNRSFINKIISGDIIPLNCCYRKLLWQKFWPVSEQSLNIIQTSWALHPVGFT